MNQLAWISAISLPVALAAVAACGDNETKASGDPGASASGGSAGSEVAATDGGAPAGAATASAGSTALLPGQAGTASTPSGPDCAAYNQPCERAADCCSGICDPATGACASSINQCTPAGQPCEAPTDCCGLVCTDGVCAEDTCVSDSEQCSSSEVCCSGDCTDGACQPLNPECRTAGNSCVADEDCCSTLCSDGLCQLGASFCIQTGDICSRGTDCCSGICNAEAGNVGTCADPPDGPSRCRGVEGTVCAGCGDCCSRLCAPYGPTGVFVCQPARGCRILGDLCRENADCCGAAGSGLPGDGNVDCVKENPGDPIGVCRNPRGCSPQGNVCHYKEDEDYPCQAVSSAPNNCCAGTGNSGVCQLDELGVPRCNGLGDTCRQVGETCSSAADCCDNVPCVRGDDGVFRCYDPPGDDPCVPSGGPCTVDADCCPPISCIRPVGSTQGTCGEPPPDDGEGGSGGQPGAGGQGGTADVPCAQYGQLCNSDADCCNDVPCASTGVCAYSLR